MKKLVSWCVPALEILAGAALLAMMSVVAIDVVLRNLGLGYISGVIDLTSLALIVATGFAIPVTFARNRHLVVELGTSGWAASSRAWIEGSWVLMGGLLLLYVAYEVLMEGLHLAEMGRYKGVLRISPLMHHSLAAFALFATATSMLLVVVRKGIGHRKPCDEDTASGL